MDIKKQGNVYVVILKIGEELLSSLTRFAKEENVIAGSIHAIGALRDFELGYYYLDKKEYGRKKFSEVAELISCSGNLAIKEGNPFVHIHVAMGREDYTVIGGHFFSGIVTVTAEVLLFPFPEKMDRTYDERTGLFLLNCKEH
jgi:predicted DNA-binding protein with PD1-like motif